MYSLEKKTVVFRENRPMRVVKKSLTLKLDPETDSFIREYAAATGKNLSDVMTEAIFYYRFKTEKTA